MVDVERVRSRTFVVTGLASGIGLATARRLPAEGGSFYDAANGGVVLLTKNIALDYGPSAAQQRPCW